MTWQLKIVNETIELCFNNNLYNSEITQNELIEPTCKLKFAKDWLDVLNSEYFVLEKLKNSEVYRQIEFLFLSGHYIEYHEYLQQCKLPPYNNKLPS
jgi:hypothetical protein